MIEKPPGAFASTSKILWAQGLPEKCLSLHGGTVLWERNRGGKEADCWSGQQLHETQLSTCCPLEGRALASSWLRNTVRGKTKIKDIILQGVRQLKRNKSHCLEEKEKTYGGIPFSCSVQRWMHSSRSSMSSEISRVDIAETYLPKAEIKLNNILLFSLFFLFFFFLILLHSVHFPESYNMFSQLIIFSEFYFCIYGLLKPSSLNTL